MTYTLTKDTIFVYQENETIMIDRSDFNEWIIEKDILYNCEDSFDPGSWLGHKQTESVTSFEDFYKSDITSQINDYLECIRH